MDWQQTREELLGSDDVQQMIAERAYHISESRGFEDGHQIEDWVQAENDILDYLQREFEARNAEPPAASAMALTDSSIFEEPVAAPVASEAISAEAVGAPAEEVEEKSPAVKKAAPKRAPKNAAPKAASTKTRETKSVKTTAPKTKPTVKKASKKSTGTSPTSGAGD